MENTIENSTENNSTDSKIDTKDKRNISFFLNLDETKKITNKPTLNNRKYSHVQRIPNTDLFIVNINDVPYFYTTSKKEAIDKARSYLDFYRTDLDRKYFIDSISEDELHLVSTRNYFITQYDYLECVAKIQTVPQIRFMVQ
jgi:hypothetical protein